MLSYLAATIIVIYSCAAFSVSGSKSETVCKGLDINRVDSAQTGLISTREIGRLLAANNLNPIGKTYKQIDNEAIEKLLHKNPAIKQAECYKTPNGTLRMYVVQRRPKFRVVTSSENYYVDKEGFILPASPGYSAYVPVVSGNISRAKVTGELSDFITFLEENPFWNDQIEQIYVAHNQTIELVPRVGDSLILLGTLDNYEKKLKKLEKLYTKVFNQIGWNHYKSIDLRYKDQVVCTRK